jgi:carboxypeptidase family protein
MQSLGPGWRWIRGLPQWVPLLVVGVLLIAASASVVVVSRDSHGSDSAAEQASQAAGESSKETEQQREEDHGRATPGGGLTTEAGKTPDAHLAEKGKLPKPVAVSQPAELHLTRAASEVFDVRKLTGPVVRRERPEHEDPFAGNTEATTAAATMPATASPSAIAAAAAPAPAPLSSFEGLDFANWGTGHPPDTNGDVGPTYFIQTVNTAIGIYDKSSGNRVAAFTFNSFMSQGHFGNLCDTNNFGDPVVLYDSFEDRWFITDFAFTFDVSGNISPPGVFQCFAVSKTGDPVNGGWNYYSILAPGGLDDYPKFGVWPDGIYMSANMFGPGAGDGFISPHVWALNKAQMYAGEPSPSVVDFAAPAGDFTLLPANARLQAGTPPPGTPEYFVATEEFLNAQTVYKLHVDWDKISTSTFTGPDVPRAALCWPPEFPASALTPGSPADVVAIRAMAQTQYSNIGGTESLWASHTVERGEVGCGGTTGGLAAPRWYQINVTGGTVAANDVQSKTWDPDGANVFYRFMPSLAVDRMGDMAIGYSKSNSTTNPQIKYAGRLFSDPVNTFSQGEQTLIDGTGSQSGDCADPSACRRWGDYSGMALDPDGCTFWETNEYYQVTGFNYNTRIGSFRLPGCTTVGNGTLSGTVTDGTHPIAGATVTLGSRTTTTSVSGAYSFMIPAGTYPSLTAAKAGFDTASATSLVVPDGGTLTNNFVLSASAASGCFTDNSQTTFQRGVPNGCSLTASPGAVTIARRTAVDQQNTTVGSNLMGFTTTSWAGQTFTPSVTGQLTEVDLDLSCLGCSGTEPNITVSIRATTGSPPVPTGPDLATATIPGFNSGTADFYAATFSSPATLTAGTRYAVIIRPVSAPVGTYFSLCSCGRISGFVNASSDSNPYVNGQRVSSSNSGSTWSPDTAAGGRDLGFKVWVDQGFPPSGTFESSLKDANPAATAAPRWTTITYSATTPTGTDVRIQVAASNTSYGPFNYVGPDGTAATFFTSGASLSQFNGFRYLRYKAFLTMNNSAVTPSLSSVQVCFVDVGTTTATTLAVASATGTFGGTTTLSATLTAGGSGVFGKTVAFTLNGNSVGNATTNASGVATLSNVSLAGINAGTYLSGVGASFAGDSVYGSSSRPASLTVAKADQTISVTTHAPASAVYNTSFGVAATGGDSPNPVTFSSSGACTNTGASVMMTSGTGICSVKYDQAGDSNYNAAAQVTESVTAQKAGQTITVTIHAPASAAVGGHFTVAATGGGSGNPVTFSSSGTCTNSGATFTMTGAGTCSVMYDQAGNANYDDAPQVVELVNSAKTDQAITVTTHAPSSAVFNTSFTVAATGGGSLNAVTFTSSGACSNTGATFTITNGTGTCSVKYDQAGDANYNDAPQVIESVTAQKADQTISVTTHAPSSAVFNTSFGVAATGGESGNPVTFSSGDVCTNTGADFTMTSGIGTCSVHYDQAGDDNYNDAAEVTETVNAAKADQAILVTQHAPGSAVFGTGFNVAATGGGSANPVTFSSAGSCTNTGAAFTMTGGIGTCSVHYDQAGDDNYNAAPQVTETVNAQKADQAITVTTHAPLSAVFNASFGVAANAPGGVVTFTSAGGCMNSGNTFTMTSGTTGCLVHYDQIGNDDYNAAPQVTETVNAQKAEQTITFASLPDKTYGDANFAPGATASSGLTVGYSAAGNCTTDGVTVHITGAGSCQVTATQSGDANYNAASSVMRSFSIATKTLTITASDRSKVYGATLTLGTTAFTTSGLVPGDGIAGVTLTSAGAAAGAAPGTYPIVPSAAVAAGGTNLGNYDVHYANGTLSVFLNGIVGLDSVNVSGKGLIDSFDSSLGPYGPGNSGSAARIASNGPIGLDGILHGDLVSTAGTVNLKSSSLVTGNVVAGQKVTNNGTVLGTVTQNSPSPAITAAAVPACSPFSTGAGIGGQFTYNAAKGDLSVAGGKSATLANGSYCFHNVTLSGGSTLTVSGSVTIFLTGQLNGAGNLDNTTHLPANLQISSSFTGANGVTLAGGNSTYLRINAPQTDVTVSGSSAVFGWLLGRTLTISGGSSVHVDVH